MRRARACALSIAVAALSASSIARADKLTDAEELFRRAKALMNEKKDKDACPLFEESEKLDPQMGTLLNLAICHENIGRVASAWGEFRAVEQMAKIANREDRIKLARDRAAKLEPRLPRLKLVLPAESKVAGIVVKVDGEAKAESLWGGIAVDPGMSTVETSAPGKKPQTAQVKIDGEGTTATYTVPKLEDAPPPPPETGDPEAAAKDKKAREEQYAANKSKKSRGIVIGGAGIAIMAAGGVMGVLALMKNSDAKAACAPCAEGSKAATDADSATDRALLFANIANVAIPVGALVTILGGYVMLSAGPTSEPGATKTAYIAPHPGGAALGLRW